MPEGQDIGRTFPVADRIQDRVLISTKSIDLSAKSYKDASKLKSRINSYLKSLAEFEEKHPEVYGKGILSQKGYITTSKYSSKKLELIIPDIPLSKEQIEVLEGFSDRIIIKILKE